MPDRPKASRMLRQLLQVASDALQLALHTEISSAAAVGGSALRLS